MTATSSVHSNALNFMSSMKNGVDQRTGLYTISIDLPEVQTNDLRGPGFGLGLAYSPLNTLDTGYGLGWNLQLSQYTLGKNILSLSTGETFKVTGSAGMQLVMAEKKLDSFHFYKVDDTHFRVVHKSGMVEILKEFGSSENRVALPVEIYSPVGHKITLHHVPFSGSHHILAWIKDDSGQTLLSVKRESSSVEVLLQPFADPDGGPDGGPLARFVMTLGSSSKYVEKITLPTENEASWRFGYSLKNDQLCISSVETPSGGREVILYEDLGHQFPQGSNKAPLPRVTGHRTYPGAGQPMIEVGYTYPGEKNFVGFGLSVQWDDDGLDNLYKYIGAYDYVCVESLLITDAPTEADPRPKPKAVRAIERTFNQFHLLTSETTTQNNNVQTVETTYDLKPNVPFEQQSTYCQLPHEVKTTWTLRDNVTRQRSETVKSTYDTHGNLLTQTQANGVVQTSTWYPAADANDFVRYMKEQTVTPAASPNGKAPTLVTRYTYKTLPPLTGSPVAAWLTPESVTQVQLETSGETELQRTLYTHVNQPGDGFLHGRVERQAVTLQGKSSFIDYQYEKFDSPQLKVPVQQTTETLRTDFDDASRGITRQHSLLTSQELLSLVDGVETRYTYDALNRLAEEVTAPGTDYEARRQYEYTLSAVNGQQIEHVIINAKKIRTRVVLDGLGRAVFEERDHVDSADPGRTRQTSAALYNAWGDLAEQTVFDWLDGKQLALTTRVQYDDWAQQCTVIGPDGVEEHQTTDPIGTPESNGPIKRSWRQSTGPAPKIQGMSETWLNRFGKPSRTRVLDAAQQEIATQTYLYDGLGRCTQQSDPYKRITQFTYDAWSRMVSSTLPDANIVKREYAAHSASELPVALRVSGDGVKYTLVGEQEFDGLERLVRLTTGQRTERYAYEGGQMQVSSKTTPANQTITYDYNLTLTDQPIGSHAEDETASFTYDHTSARLTQAKNEQGIREYDYNAANQLLGERWVDKQGKAWHTLHSSSMQGLLLKRTDLKHENSDGLDTVYHYDDLGQLKSIDQGQLEAKFEYDKLGQLTKTTTTDLAAKSMLVTELEYDDQGRETLRTLTLDQQSPRTQKQTWKLDGLLQSRHLTQGAVNLLHETFDYDLRGRLITHTCSGDTLPRDSEGRKIVKQIFTFTELDNIRLTMTNFSDESYERAVFNYSTDDPFRLEQVAYTPKRVTGDPTFAYDLNGNQVNDERGQRLIYDSQNRLLNVKNTGGQVISQYRYDSHDHLVNSQQGESETLRFYQDQQLNAVVEGDRQTRILYHMDQPLGQQQAGDTAQTLLLMTDANHSVLGESRQRDLRTAVYSAYGERHSDDTLQSLLAFNGEVRDQVSGWYLLGRGYRAYNPILMRFHSPDSLSPFGSGGVNPYNYCLGNPIALRDPTGHEAIGWSGRLRRTDEDAVPGLSGGGGGVMEWIGVAVGAVFVAIGVVSFVVSLGTSGPVSLALIAVGTGLSLGSTIASAVGAATGNDEARNWGTYLGFAAIVPAAPLIVHSAYKGVSKIMMEFGKRSAGKEIWKGIQAGGTKQVQQFTIPRPQVGSSSRLSPMLTAGGSTPPPPQGPALTLTPTPTPTPPPNPISNVGGAGIQPNLNQITQMKSQLKPPPPSSPAKPGGSRDLLLEQLKAATSRRGTEGEVLDAVTHANSTIPAETNVTIHQIRK